MTDRHLRYAPGRAGDRRWGRAQARAATSQLGWLLIWLLLGASLLIAAAQAENAPSSQTQVDPTQDGVIAPSVQNPTQPSPRTGVVKPPNDVDPAIRTAPSAPSGMTMKVIPPPGTPGGDPSVVPK